MYGFEISTCPGTGDSVGASTARGIFGDDSQPAQQSRLRVLVVDDDRDLADTTQTLLEMLGIHSECAYSVEGALSKLDRDPTINVILCDVIMPGLTGLDLAALVKARHPFVGIVLVSGYTSMDTTGAREYTDGFIAKPYNIHDVVDHLIAAMKP